MRVLFVCLGNICRSPTAEGVMRSLLARYGASGIELDSAGTGDWHVDEPPDARATEAARRRGIRLEGRARQVSQRDFAEFDLILAMDGSNQHALRQLAPDEHGRMKVKLLREFDPASAEAQNLDVPDPYYGGPTGFDDVLDLVQAACEGLLEHIRSLQTA
jgi:low molecular weight protein-tyrosine phosphatase